MIGATCDVLPSPQTLNQWFAEDEAFTLCSGVCSLRHILSGCKVSLSQGQYTWRHNQVLKCLAEAVDDKRREANSSAKGKECRQINFVRQGEKARPVRGRHRAGQLSNGGAWEMKVDLIQQVVGPLDIPNEMLHTAYCC